jgi:hypothetical protein
VSVGPYQRINWTAATIVDIDETPVFPGEVRLIAGTLGEAWRIRVFDDTAALIFNEPAASSLRQGGEATIVFVDGTVWHASREGDCGCG